MQKTAAEQSACDLDYDFPADHYYVVRPAPANDKIRENRLSRNELLWWPKSRPGVVLEGPTSCFWQDADLGGKLQLLHAQKKGDNDLGQKHGIGIGLALRLLCHVLTSVVSALAAPPEGYHLLIFTFTFHLRYQIWKTRGLGDWVDRSPGNLEFVHIRNVNYNICSVLFILMFNISCFDFSLLCSWKDTLLLVFPHLFEGSCCALQRLVRVLSPHNGGPFPYDVTSAATSNGLPFQTQVRQTASWLLNCQGIGM